MMPAFEMLIAGVMKVINNGVSASYVLQAAKVGTNPLATSLIGGMGAMLGISTSMAVSGGHINPAVSVAFALTGRFTWRKVISGAN